MGEEAPKVFSLRLAGEGINIEQQIDQRVALQIVQVVMGGGASPTVRERPDVRTSDGAPLSLREFLDKAGATKKPDQIAAIAQYVCEFERQADFSRDDIRSRFTTAREPLPKNFARDFAVALQKGWIAEVHGQKNRFYVTGKGTQAIGNSFL